MSTFNQDFPFEHIADNANLADPGVRALAEWVGRYPHKASANKRGFEKFCEKLAEVKAPWKDTLVKFTENIVGKKYDREFKKRHNRFAGGDCANPEFSQTKSMFMAFCQAVWYETEEQEETA